MLVARQLRRLVGRDAAGAELVQGAFGRYELVNDIWHTHGSTGPAGQTLAASLQVEAAGRFDVLSDGPAALVRYGIPNVAVLPLIGDNRDDLAWIRAETMGVTCKR